MFSCQHHIYIKFFINLRFLRFFQLFLIILFFFLILWHRFLAFVFIFQVLQSIDIIVTITKACFAQDLVFLLKWYLFVDYLIIEFRLFNLNLFFENILGYFQIAVCKVFIIILLSPTRYFEVIFTFSAISLLHSISSFYHKVLAVLKVGLISDKYLK